MRGPWPARLTAGIVIVILGLLSVSSMAGALAPNPVKETGTSAPAPASGGQPLPTGLSTPSRAPIQGHAAPSTGAPWTAVNRLMPNSNAPIPRTITPDWSTGGASGFFNDVQVSFSVPGQAAPPNIPTVPAVGNVSQYTIGFYMNITTDVPITAAYVYIWATNWPQPNVGAQPIQGFDPANWNTSDQFRMQIGKNPDTASWYFDCYKYFWPGSNISFIVNVISAASTPSSIWSNASREVQEGYSSGYLTYPTWEVYVEGPFASPTFENDIRISTTPSVLTKPAFDPNPSQTLQITIASFNASGGPPNPIPKAVCSYSVVSVVPGGKTESVQYSSDFAPSNSTVMQLVTPIQPEPGGTQIVFNISASLPWYGGTGQIDTITSLTYSFNFTTHGGWQQPNAPLEQNAVLSSNPGVIQPGVVSYLPTGTRVNVTVHEPVQNITISASEIDFLFNDRGATSQGSLPMTLPNLNTSYVVLPGLPPDSSLTFFVITKDLYGDPVSSGNYTYVENGTPTLAPPVGQGYFFVEVYDVAKNTLVRGVTFTVGNATWSQNSTTTRLGFGSLLAYTSDQFVFLNDGTYVISLTVFGSTIVRPIPVNSTQPYAVVFYVSSSPVALQTSSPVPAVFSIAGVAGLAGAFVCYFPIMRWFKDRRAKAEEEQRRVTL